MNTIKPTVVKDPEKKLVLQYQRLAHKKDVPILVAAIEYDCSHLITGNIKDFKEEQIIKEHNIRVMSPADFMKLLA